MTGMPVRLIILDTLARCFGNSDENTARDMGAFIQGCDAIRYHTCAAMMIVHHSGKDQERAHAVQVLFRPRWMPSLTSGARDVATLSP